MHDRVLDFVRILKIFRKLVPDAYEALVMRLNVVVVPAGTAVFHTKKKKLVRNEALVMRLNVVVVPGRYGTSVSHTKKKEKKVKLMRTRRWLCDSVLLSH